MQTIGFSLPDVAHTAAQKVQVEQSVVRRADKVRAARKVDGRIDRDGCIGMVVRTAMTVSQTKSRAFALREKPTPMIAASGCFLRTAANTADRSLATPLW